MIICNNQKVDDQNKNILHGDLTGYSLDVIIPQKDNIFKGQILNRKRIEENYSFTDTASISLYLIEFIKQNDSTNQYIAINKDDYQKWGVITIDDHFESDNDYNSSIFYDIFGFSSIGIHLIDTEFTIYLNTTLNSSCSAVYKY